MGPSREAGFQIMQHYRRQNVPEPLLMRVRRHLVFYARQGGNIPELEQMVLTQNLPPQQLIQFVESRVGRPQPGMGAGPSGPWGARPGSGAPGGINPGAGSRVPGPTGMAPQIVMKETVRIPCRYCGTLLDQGAAKCPSCSAPTA